MTIELGVVEDYANRYANVLDVLRLIRERVGTSAPNGYRYLFGSTREREVLFDDASIHPNVKVAFTQPDGTVGYSSAAGAYWIDHRAWCRAQAVLGLPDFGPDSQDRAAIFLIQERGQLGNVELGLLAPAIRALSEVWPELRRAAR